MKLEAPGSLRLWANSLRAPISFDLRALAPDIALALGLALAGFVATLLSYELLSPAIYHASTWDYWFESDPLRIFDLASDRKSIHHHSTSHHPLFSLIMFPPVQALRTVFNLSVENAIGLVLAASSAIWILLSNFTLRMLGLSRADAFVFTALMAASAAAVFWFPVPETFGIGALSIMVVMAVCAYSERRGGVPTWVYVLAGVSAMSVTTTNWLVGLAMLAVFLPWQSAIVRAIETMILVLAAWAVQHTIFPESDTFLNVFRGSEVDYLFNEESLGIVPKLFAFFFHSIVMPTIDTAYGYRLTVQAAWPGAGGPLAMAGTLAWAALLALGCWSAAQLLRERGIQGAKTITVLILAIAAQLLVAILFGIETFLYSPHFAPLLVMLAALSALTPARRIAVPLAFALAVIAGINNFQKLDDAAGRLAAQYQHEQRYADMLASQTDAKGLFICGARALAASGEAEMGREAPAVAKVIQVDSLADPDTCSFSFDGQLIKREGWRLWFEDWSIEAVQAFAKRGARYFVTQYEYGMAERKDFLDDLGKRYATVARNHEWAVYDLQRPPAH